MRRFVVGLVAVGSCWLLFGCPEALRVTPDAGLVLVVVDAGGSSGLDAGPVVDGGSSLRYLVAGALLDGGAEPLIALDEAKIIEVDSLRGLTVTSVALRDYRIRVIDSADQVVPSDDTATELDGGLTYVIAFSQPLRPGKTYALTLEAQAGPQLTDSSGMPWDDVRLNFQVRGQAEPTPLAKTKKKKR